MSTYFYDEAIIKKLKLWTQNTDISVYSPEDTRHLFEVIADKNNDSPIKLPLICLRRRGGFVIQSVGKENLSHNALRIEGNREKYMQLNAIPINLQYQIDVYTRYYQEADEYMRNLIFNMINYPKFNVVIPYENANREHMASFRIITEVSDNSSIPERLITGQFTRLSVSFDVDDAYLFDVRVRDNYSIGFQLSHPPKNTVITSYNINRETDSYPEDE